MNTYISASILGADLSNLKFEIQRIEKAGADMIHFDVMDGVFVDNISFGLPVLSSIKRFTDIPVDVHLMIVDPLKYIEQFAKAGADNITFHAESESDIDETVDRIHSLGLKAGLSIKPNTPAAGILKYLKKLDLALVMTVEPGFGGQGFIESTLDKIYALKSYIDTNGLNVDIQVDGGINDITAPLVRGAGANNLVSGSYLFNSDDAAMAVDSLRNQDS